MSFCKITSLKTDNKWKGNFIHPLVISAARRNMVGTMTLRDSIRGLRKRFHMGSQDIKNEDEYMQYVKDFLCVNREESNE